MVSEFTTQPNLWTQALDNRSQAVDPNRLINIPLFRAPFAVANLFLVESIRFSIRQKTRILLKQMDWASVSVLQILINSSSPRLVFPVWNSPLICLAFPIFLIQQKFSTLPLFNSNLRVKARSSQILMFLTSSQGESKTQQVHHCVSELNWIFVTQNAIFPHFFLAFNRNCFRPLSFKTNLKCSILHQIIKGKLHTLEFWTVNKFPKNSLPFQTKLDQNNKLVQWLTGKFFPILSPHLVHKRAQTKTQMFHIQVICINVAPTDLKHFNYVSPQPVLPPWFEQSDSPIDFPVCVCQICLFREFIQSTLISGFLESKFFLLHGFCLISHRLVTSDFGTKVKHCSISISWGVLVHLWNLHCFHSPPTKRSGGRCEVHHVNWLGWISTQQTFLRSAYTWQTLLGNAERCFIACSLIQRLSWHPFQPSNTIKFANQTLFSLKTNMAQISTLQHLGTFTDDHRTTIQIEALNIQNEAKHCFGAGVNQKNQYTSSQTHLNSHSEKVWSNTDNSEVLLEPSESESDIVLKFSLTLEVTHPGNEESVMAANTANKQVQTTKFLFFLFRILIFQVETILLRQHHADWIDSSVCEQKWQRTPWCYMRSLHSCTNRLIWLSHEFTQHSCITLARHRFCTEIRCKIVIVLVTCKNVS